jgi:hypothetical protein
MANIVRPPCDEGAILTGSCELPATRNGTWILAATILGSSMAFIDGTVVSVALPALQSALHATLADEESYLVVTSARRGSDCLRISTGKSLGLIGSAPAARCAGVVIVHRRSIPDKATWTKSLPYGGLNSMQG